MNPQTEKLVRISTMVATVTASYFLLTADYGPEPNVLDPWRMHCKVSSWLIRNATQETESQDYMASQNDPQMTRITRLRRRYYQRKILSKSLYLDQRNNLKRVNAEVGIQ